MGSANDFYTAKVEFRAALESSEGQDHAGTVGGGLPGHEHSRRGLIGISTRKKPFSPMKKRPQLTHTLGPLTSGEGLGGWSPKALTRPPICPEKARDEKRISRAA